MKKINADSIIRDKIEGLETSGDMPVDMAAAWQKLELRMDNTGVIPSRKKRVGLYPIRIAAVAASLLLAIVLVYHWSGQDKPEVYLRRVPGIQQLPASQPGGAYAKAPARGNTVQQLRNMTPMGAASHPTAGLKPRQIAELQPLESPVQDVLPNIANDAPVTESSGVVVELHEQLKHKQEPVLKRDMEVVYVDNLFDVPERSQTAPAKTPVVKIGNYSPIHKDEPDAGEAGDVQLVARGRASKPSTDLILIKF